MSKVPESRMRYADHIEVGYADAPSKHGRVARFTCAFQVVDAFETVGLGDGKAVRLNVWECER